VRKKKQKRINEEEYRQQLRQILQGAGGQRKKTKFV
jgi:hypothetical protein